MFRVFDWCGSSIVSCTVALVVLASLGSAQARGFQVLHAFRGGSDGAGPSGLMRDRLGNLYGTTSAGGAANAGTVFEISANGVETALYAFKGAGDGTNPLDGVVEDNSGDLYGVTCGCSLDSHGTVFKLAPGGTETVLYSFTGGADGGWPEGVPVLDNAGTLFGTTFVGGSNACGCGVVFALVS